MKKHRIPNSWLQLHSGDQIGSRLPLHRIESMIAQLANDGWHLRTAPSDYGYWIICEVSPNDSCAQNRALDGACEVERMAAMLRDAA